MPALLNAAAPFASRLLTPPPPTLSQYVKSPILFKKSQAVTSIECSFFMAQLGNKGFISLTFFLFDHSSCSWIVYWCLIIIYIIKSGVCLFVCGHSNVPTLTSPPVFKLLDSQGYVWLPYDLAVVIKLIGVTFKQKIYIFFQKITLCHSFRISVIPSRLLSFLPDFCHSFRILSFLPNYYHFKYLSP